MIPTKVYAHFYGPYLYVEWAIPDGVTAIVGRNETSEGATSNGAGKTKLLELVPLALFGPRTSWSEYLTLGEDEPCKIGLEVAHDGNDFRIERSYSPKGRGKTTLDFFIREDMNPQPDGNPWNPLTLESQAETQKNIETLLGVSEATFSHAAFASQGGQHFADPELAPRERKAILADALGLDVWEKLLDAVRADKHLLAQEIAGYDWKLADWARELEASEELQAEREALRTVRDVVAENSKDAEQFLAGAVEKLEAQKEQLGKRAVLVAELALALEQFKGLNTVQRAARGAREEASALATRSLFLQDLVEQAPALEEQLLRWELHDKAGKELASAEREHERLLVELAALEHAEQCALCGQTLNSTARAASQTVLGERHERSSEQLTRLRAALPEPPELLANELQELLRGARTADRELAEGRGRARQLDEVIARAGSASFEQELLAAEAGFAEKQLQLDELGRPEAGNLQELHDQYLAEQRLCERRLRELDLELARMDERLERLAGLTERHAEALAARNRSQAQLDILAALERAYGRDGIPALILESSAIPQIEAEAQRVLEALGVPLRIELQTQRETKSTGALKDTLEVLVHEPNGVRSYGSYSGGEQTRIEIALRIGLARLLAHRRGASLGLLALDELPYLDMTGQRALAGVLHGLSQEFSKILVISHDPMLADAIGQAVTVVRDANGVSRLAD